MTVRSTGTLVQPLVNATMKHPTIFVVICVHCSLRCCMSLGCLVAALKGAHVWHETASACILQGLFETAIARLEAVASRLEVAEVWSSCITAFACGRPEFESDVLCLH